jgi:hypothetical protein
MDQERDLLGLIRDVIYQETRWNKHYLAQVFDNNDPISKGRVNITIPELGFDRPDQALWAYPRQGNSMNVPNIGDWVEVYFLSADPNRPVYLHLASEMLLMIPTSYGGVPSSRVIFESPITKDNIVYDDLLKKLTALIIGEILIDGSISITLNSSGQILINGTTIVLNSGTEPFVKGNALITYLTSLVTNINNNYTLIATAISGLGGTYVPVPATNPAGTEISTEIFGK